MNLADPQRIVITGVGLAAPNGDNLSQFRESLLAGRSGVVDYETRYIGHVLAGVCNFDEFRYQKKKERRRGTRAGSVSIYCANEAVADSGLNWETVKKDRVGVYLGITEHGNVETENEIWEISQFDYDTKVWSHHHNPRTVANNPAGEVTLNLKITGPHLTIGAACAAGNAGFIQAVQMLRLNEVDLAIAGGVSESIHTFGIFASFASQGALAMHEDPTKASRPFDQDRCGIVVAEGGGICTLERLPDALARGAKIYGEVVGYAMNSDASDFVLPNRKRQAECVRLALSRANMQPSDIDILSSHATATEQGDIEESQALAEVFGDVPTRGDQQYEELHRPRDGCRRRFGVSGQSAELCGPDGPRYNQPRSARSPLPSAPDRRQSPPATRPGRGHSEQLVRHAGDQLGAHRAKIPRG